MSDYTGRYAQIYDAIYAGKPYKDEVDFIDKLSIEHRRTRGSLLDMACGTGTHAFMLSDLGYEVVAFDLSESMLDVAQKKQTATPCPAQFLHGDMRTFQYEEKQFDVIVCLFNAIGYITETQDMLKTLGQVYNNLAPGGLFIFDFWNAAAMLRNFEPVRVLRIPKKESEIIRISETSLNYPQQTCSVKYTLIELLNNGSYHQTEESQLNRFFTVNEMEGLLTTAGLKAISWHEGLTEGTDITTETWHIGAVAKRPLEG